MLRAWRGARRTRTPCWRSRRCWCTFAHGIVPAWVFKAGLVLLLFGLPIVLATA
jgi:hypothetical protein